MDKFLDWCLKQPNWIGFPIWFFTCVSILLALLITLYTYPPLLIAVPILWLVAVAIHYTRK